MTWCPKPFVLRCSSIQLIRTPLRLQCGTRRRPPPLWDFKSNHSTPRRLANSIRPLRQCGAKRADVLVVAGDAFFLNRRTQFVTRTARDKIPAAFSQRAYVEAGGLMSYGTDIMDSFRQVGVYTSKILKGAKPADLPVLQSTKFEFVINRHTARALGIEMPPGVLSIADEAIE